jgi:cyclic pyranopterin phosphate synthase
MPKQSGVTFLDKNEFLTFAEIKRAVLSFSALGVRKIKLTGGEPLLRPRIEELIHDLRTIHPSLEINLITNGVLLAERVAALRGAGLDRLTVSLDTLRPERFLHISGREGQLDQIWAGLKSAKAAGFAPVKINMVVIRGENDDEVIEMASRFRGTGMVLRFIEYMDVGTMNHWRKDRVVPSAEILERLQAVWPLVQLKAKTSGETAKRYAYVDGAGEIGFISSVSEPFCGDCSRLRLSADGQLYTCLFASMGFDFKKVLRDPASDPLSAIAHLWKGRSDQYSVDRSLSVPRRKIQMFYIGG